MIVKWPLGAQAYMFRFTRTCVSDHTIHLLFHIFQGWITWDKKKEKKSRLVGPSLLEKRAQKPEVMNTVWINYFLCLSNSRNVEEISVTFKNFFNKNPPWNCFFKKKAYYIYYTGWYRIFCLIQIKYWDKLGIRVGWGISICI